jgi:hypothetical protein
MDVGFYPALWTSWMKTLYLGTLTYELNGKAESLRKVITFREGPYLTRTGKPTALGVLAKRFALAAVVYSIKALANYGARNFVWDVSSCEISPPVEALDGETRFQIAAPR